MLAVSVLPVSCVKDLLEYEHPTQLSSGVYWNTLSDAEEALNGVYASVRGCFDRDYLFDGHAEFTRVRQTYVDTYNSKLDYDENLFNGCAYANGVNAWSPDNYGEFDSMYEFLYGGVNRANYLIDNVTDMVNETGNVETKIKLEIIIGEARLLRGMCYFKLITMWGDVPCINKTVKSPSEVETLARMPIGDVYATIIEDFTFASEKLPDHRPISEWGRATKPAALAFRGKARLYWASWNNFGWPELKGFTPSAAVANAAYAEAAADFKSVIDNFGLKLFRDGAPGEWGQMGRADVLPNYYDLFTAKANGDSEFIFAFNHGGPKTSGYKNQGDQLMRLFAGRGHQNSQSGVMPRYEVADRYQLVATGGNAPKLTPTGAMTNNAQYVTPNSARNPDSYIGRDYRMKASILWDFEVSMAFTDLKATGYAPWLYYVSALPVTQAMVDNDTYRRFTQWNVGQTTNGTPTNQSRSGYAFRKFVRNDDEQLYRNEGNFNWPVMRLADVYLMYAEAINEANNGPDQKAIDLVNMIRARGALPALDPSKTAGKSAFFDAIEQERIIELLAEGHRCFDIRRWRAIERIFGAPNTPSEYCKDTRNENDGRYYHNMNELRYQQNYICKIPQKERDRNPNLTQNTPWL
jgi:hypothetical protein